MVHYNAEIMIFKCRRCGLKYGQKKAFPHYYVRLRRKRRNFEPRHKPTKKKNLLKNVLIATVAITMLFAAAYILYWHPISFPNSISLPNLFPAVPSHDELVNYTLSLINADRQSHNLQNVTLSSVNSGQQHAEDMLRNKYFSHWDIQGYKPYMRYTLAGGKGSVAENCAAQLGSYSDLKEALKEMEWNMMYDDAASNWGHRDNILNPLHNKVSIGIAYDSNNVYLVQDFENDFVTWTTLRCSSNQVIMQGTMMKAGLSISGVAVFYDKVGNLTAQQLSNPPYQGGYDVGTSVGMALPSGWQAGDGITITASTWSQTGQNFAINFDLSTAFARYGKGVYTLYLMTGSSTDSSLTTYSIWYGS